MNLSALRRRLAQLPMLRALVPLAAGILLSERIALPGWLLAAAFLSTGAAALLLRSSLHTVAMLFTAGFAVAQLRRTPPGVPRDRATLFEIVVEGIPARRSAIDAADAAVTAWRDPADGHWHPSGDRIVLRSDTAIALAAGERIRCRGYLRPLRGAEGYRRLMARRGYAGSLRLREGNLLERLPGRAPAGLHRRAAERLARAEMPPGAAWLVRAMVAGDRSGLTPERREAFARSGLAHLLAVSGLHTGIVFLAVNLLLGWLPLLRRGHLLRNAAAAAAVWLFVAAAGFPPSAVRAAVMCTLLQFALASASEYAAMNALAAAAFGMLLWNPAWIGDISFRLSFAAVGAILAWGVPLCRRCRTGRRLADALIGAYAIGFAATAGTAPLIAHTFGILPVAGLAINPAAILLAGAVVGAGTLALLLPAGPLAAPALFVASRAAEGIDRLARLTAALPGGAVECTLSGRTTGLIYLIFIAATAAAWCAEPKKSVPLSR